MGGLLKYRGLCETCDFDATCTLKRSPRLEIIHCEQFFAQPIMYRQTPIQDEALSSVPLRSNGTTTRRGKRAAFKNPG